MNRIEFSEMISDNLSASEESSEPDGPDLRTGSFQLNMADFFMEA
jgi:hypothetical protein